MRGLPSPLFGALALLLSANARAQASPGDDAGCAKVLDEAAAGCAEIALSEKEVKALKKRKRELEPQLADTTKTPAELAVLRQEFDELGPAIDEKTKSFEALKDTPLEKLNGFCVSVAPSTPRTCDALSSRLGAFDEESVKSVAKAAKAEAAEADAELARNAAASDRRTSNNKSGSSAQIDPVESIQPITVAGGALTLSGTRTGSKGVGTISVNPLALAVPDSVTLARLLDLSVSAPFDLEGSDSNNAPYISARARVNITGPFNAAELQRKVDAWLAASGLYADKLETLLQHAKDVKACAFYIAQNGRAAASACEQDVDSGDVRKARLEAYAEMARARRAADKCYLGLDLRFDTGDPTGPDIIGDRGTHLLGGLAAGTRIALGQLWDWELRGRVAGDYFQSRDPLAGEDPKPVPSFDWGGAVLFSGRMQEAAKQRMAFGVGMEGRHALNDSENAKLSPTNYWHLNFMAVVPAVTGGDLGLAIAVPLVEGRERRGVSVSFSTDLGLLDHSP